MLTIRSEQMKVFERNAHERFEVALVKHLEIYFPGQCRLLGMDSVRSTMRFGVLCAAQYQFHSEREVFLYLALMFLFGSSFDEDRRLSWTRPFLQVSPAPGGFETVRALYQAGTRYLNRTIGPSRTGYKKLLLRLRKLDVNAATEQLGSDQERGMTDVLRRLHPLKAAELSDNGLRGLVGATLAEAEKARISGPLGILTHLILTFILGSGYAGDPQFPWASAVWNDGKLSPDERADVLLRSAKHHLERALAAGVV